MQWNNDPSLRSATGQMLFLGITAGLASATTVPFTEEFANDAANWRDSTGTTQLTWNAVGGPDNGSYASGTFNFVNSTTVDTPAVFRAHDEFGSSGGAFVGNWISDGVQSLCVLVRHDVGVPLNYFVRFAGPANFPAAVSVISTAVPSGQWTRLEVPIPDPGFIFEGPFTFAQVFSNIGHVQIGVAVPAALAGVDQSFTFDVDKVHLSDGPACAPAMSSVAMSVLSGCLLVAGGGLLRRRRIVAGAANGS